MTKHENPHGKGCYPAPGQSQKVLDATSNFSHGVLSLRSGLDEKTHRARSQKRTKAKRLLHALASLSAFVEQSQWYLCRGRGQAKNSLNSHRCTPAVLSSLLTSLSPLCFRCYTTPKAAMHRLPGQQLHLHGERLGMWTPGASAALAAILMPFFKWCRREVEVTSRASVSS